MRSRPTHRDGWGAILGGWWCSVLLCLTANVACPESNDPNRTRPGRHVHVRSEPTREWVVLLTVKEPYAHADRFDAMVVGLCGEHLPSEITFYAGAADVAAAQAFLVDLNREGNDALATLRGAAFNKLFLVNLERADPSMVALAKDRCGRQTSLDQGAR